jgi:hypothetical protein
LNEIGKFGYYPFLRSDLGVLVLISQLDRRYGGIDAVDSPIKGAANYY